MNWIRNVGGGVADERAGAIRSAVMADARTAVNRWTARFVDDGQERRYRRSTLRAQRRGTALALVFVVLADLVIYLYAVLFGSDRHGVPLLMSQVVLVVGSAALVLFVLRARTTGQIRLAAIGTVLFLTGCAAAVIVTGVRMDVRGAFLILGGTAIVYQIRLPRLGVVTALAVIYTAVTGVAWWLGTPAQHTIEVEYLVLVEVLTHLMSVNAARRSGVTGRRLFAGQQALYRMSTADPLTGLANRRTLDRHLARVWKNWRASGTPVSLLMIDVDRFKRVNDSAGHLVGDDYLRTVAAAIARALTGLADPVARYGGEEFACVLPGVDADAAAGAARRVMQAIREQALPLPEPCGPGILTVSIGLATATPGMAGVGELIATADRMLYRAKEAGRNRIEAPWPTGPSALPRQVRRGATRPGERSLLSRSAPE